MPRRVPRSQRRHVRRTQPARPEPSAPVAGELPATPVSPVATLEATKTSTPAATASEPSVTRFGARDYAYVKRELQRIAILAGAIIIIIIVLSFFLP